MSSVQLVADVNLVAEFLAHDQVPDLLLCNPVDCISICVSSVFHQFENLFHALETRPDLTKTLVLVGGVGHSTPLIYSAVAQHRTYNSLAAEVDGLPESRVLERILHKYFDVDKITSRGCRILVEDKSTNCGGNASETKKLLENAGVQSPQTMIVVQDPTMSLRTIATFEKVYEGAVKLPKFLACPIFVPHVQSKDGEIEYVVSGVKTNDLWPLQRFCELLVGEIPRLKDDEHGYGPKGKGFLVHVDVSEKVEEAAKRISEQFEVSR